MKVKDPRGHTWRISRRWVPWRRRFKGSLEGLPDIPDIGGGDDPITGIIGLVILVVFLPVIVLALVILGIAALELLALLVVVPFAVLGRVLLGQEWVVEVRDGFRPYWEEPAGDWAASRRRIAEVGDQLRRGDVPPRTIPLD